MSAIPKHIRRGENTRSQMLVEWAVRQWIGPWQFRTIALGAFEDGLPVTPEGNRSQRRAQRAKERRLRGTAASSPDQ